MEKQINSTRSYAGDEWQRMYIIKNGHLSDIKPTGDMVQDFGHFLFGQGGGKSNDPRDSITLTKGCYPSTPDVDGKKYHTVNDITFILYKKYFPEDRDEEFYNMKEWKRLHIIDMHIAVGRITQSDVLNLAIAYTVWGSGTYVYTIRTFMRLNGMSVDSYIEKHGEDKTLVAYLEARRITMKERNDYVNKKGINPWVVNGRGWSNGLANFYRVFKVYTKN